MEYFHPILGVGREDFLCYNTYKKGHVGGSRIY